MQYSMLTTIAPKGMTYFGNSYDNQADNKTEKWNSSDLDIFQTKLLQFNDISGSHKTKYPAQ